MTFIGEFTLGDGTYYGATAGVYPNIRYGVLIDWDGDKGFSSDGNDAPRLLSWSSDRGRGNLINNSGNGLEPVQIGELNITLDNSDGRYDAYNTKSPLYPNVLPGRKIQFIVQDCSTLTNHYVFTGEIEDIKPFSQEKTVQISAIDPMRKLKEQDATIALNTTIKVSDAIIAILESIGYTDYSIDSLLDIIPYWWVNQQKAAEAIQELCNASFGTFFIAADGKAKYYSRSKAVSSVLNLTQDVLLKDMAINQPWDVIRNNIDVIINPLVKQTIADLWALWDKPSVLPGETIEIWGSFKYNSESCPATGVISPVANTDYTMNTASDGSGSDLTGSFTVTVTIFGESVKWTIKNNSLNQGYLTMLKIRGEAITAPNSLRINKTDNSSVGIYGIRTFKLDSKWLQNTNLGITLAETIRDLLSIGRKYPSIRINSRPDIQYTADLFDRIGLVLADLGVDGAYRIGSIKHGSRGDETCQEVVTTITLEPVIDVADVYWVFPTLIGQTSYFA